VNFALRRACVVLDPASATLSDVMTAIEAIGYRAHPYDPARREALARSERRDLLLRAGLSLLAMMQVMMFAFPVYLADEARTTAGARTRLVCAAVVGAFALLGAYRAVAMPEALAAGPFCLLP
jgi:P-type Cu2+ transporter